MSEKQEGFRIDLPEKVWRILEKEAKKDGLTVKQEVTLAMLYFFKKYDAKLFEETKQIVQERDPAVLRVFEKQTA